MASLVLKVGSLTSEVYLSAIHLLERAVARERSKREPKEKGEKHDLDATEGLEDVSGERHKPTMLEEEEGYAKRDMEHVASERSASKPTILEEEQADMGKEHEAIVEDGDAMEVAEEDTPSKYKAGNNSDNCMDCAPADEETEAAECDVKGEEEEMEEASQSGNEMKDNYGAQKGNDKCWETRNEDTVAVRRTLRSAEEMTDEDVDDEKGQFFAPMHFLLGPKKTTWASLLADA